MEKGLTPVAEIGEICILAGGQSRRMGRDKARLRLRGKTLLEHVQAVAARTSWSGRVIRRDLVPRCGPLGGVYTALKTTRRQFVLFLACDMPFVTVEYLQRLIHVGTGRRSVFTKGPEGAGFPFVLPQAALVVVEKQIAAAQYSLQNLSLECRARFLAPTDFGVLFNVNTPEDWKRAGI